MGSRISRTRLERMLAEWDDKYVRVFNDDHDRVRDFASCGK